MDLPNYFHLEQYYPLFESKTKSNKYILAFSLKIVYIV